MNSQLFRRTALLALSLFATAWAAEPAAPRQAFGPILFGDDATAAQKHQEEFLAVLDRRKADRLNATDVVSNFVTKGTKYPPKLTPKYAKTFFDLYVGEAPVKMIDVTTDQFEFSAVPTVKPDWEVLRDIASSKFGIPTKSAPYPQPSDLVKGPYITDTWTVGTLKIEIIFATVTDTPPKFFVVLRATDTAPAPAAK
jgi:hypothetical protein